MYDDEHPTVEALHTMEEHLSGIVPMFLYLESDTSLYTVEGLQTIQRLEEQLETYDFIHWSTSIASQQSVIHQALTETNGLPTTDDMLAQERLLVDLSGGLPNSNVVSEDGHKTRIMLCKDVGGINFSFKVRQIANQSLGQSTFNGHTGGMLASIGIDKLIGDLMSSVGLVFGIILIVLGVMLRNVAHTLLRLFPMRFLLTTLAFWGAGRGCR